MKTHKKRENNWRCLLLRAENETRTRDPNLGKVMLYQLSYFRKFSVNKLERKTRLELATLTLARLCSTN